MVCEKKKYFLFGIKCSNGTSFTPIITSASDTSSVTSNPNFYKLHLKTLEYQKTQLQIQLLEIEL